MAKAGFAARIGLAALLLGGAALSAQADGLDRFKKAIKDAPEGVLKYESAEALGDKGFVLEDVVLTAPPGATPGPKAEPVKIDRIAVEEFDFDSAEKGAPPNFMRIKIEGLTVGAKPAEGVDLKDLAGIDEISASFEIDYRLNPGTKTLTVNRVALDLADLARLELSLVVEGITAELFGQPDAAMNDATLRTASLTFEDRSLLGKLVPAAAKMQGSDADALVKMGKEMLNGMRDGQGPQTVAILNVLASFMDDYKQPKGPIKISLTPTAKTSAAKAMADIKTPDDAVKALGLVVTY